jgi:DNA repair protein RecN (Recombination protein N)
MLTELRVRDLGVISDVHVSFDGGLTVITGETGAGKTLIVEALELVLGGRADVTMVRHGSDEALVEARFRAGEDEYVFSRTVARGGRSRAELNGRMVTISALEEAGQSLVDLYGQHDHQSLLRKSAQREALDAFANTDLVPLRALRADLRTLDDRLAALGGDERSRSREIDLLRFELQEIENAEIVSEDEDTELLAEEERLASAIALKQAAHDAHDSLVGASAPGASELLGVAIEALAAHGPLKDHEARLRGLLAELDDATNELRLAGEGFEEDPQRLEIVRARRDLLRRLVHKHGESLADVYLAASKARVRIEELVANDELRQSLEVEREALCRDIEAAERVVGDKRRLCAHDLGEAVQGHLARLALRGARFVVSLPDEGLADDVEFFFGPNAGEPDLPLAKIASGGELARTMLALRLVCTHAPETLVFDEVDAGIGGTAALVVGKALAELAANHQVLVVTHLAQVAAQGAHHLVVEKSDVGGRMVASVMRAQGQARVVELSRLLSGQPDSTVAREHASELLASSGKKPGA